jgi:hypothetical protein
MPWKNLQSLRRWNLPVHEGNLHIHSSHLIGAVRRDPTTTPFSAGSPEGLLGFGSTPSSSDESASAGSFLGGGGCGAASGSASDPCAASVGRHRMQPASCSNSREDLSSNVPESSICVTAMMTRLCSNIQLCPSLTIWDGLLKGSCPPFSMLSRPNHAASVSLLLPTPGHLNSDLAVRGYSLERSGAGKPVFLGRDR